MPAGEEERHRFAEWGSDSDEAADPRSANGAGEDDRVPEDSDDVEVIDAEVVDGEPVEVAEGEVLDGLTVDDDPLMAAITQRDEYLDSLRRLQAEFENYKKRVAKQQAEQLARAAVSLVDKLLPVLDTLDLAAEHLGDAESPDAKALVAASSLLHGVLAKEGLERIDPVGEEFDPTAHEAVGHLPAEEPADADPASSAESTGEGGAPGSTEPVVAQVMRPGYRWHGTVVRPAMVMVRG